MTPLPAGRGWTSRVGTGCSTAPSYPSVFLTWQWQRQWAQAFTPERPLRFLSVTDDDGSLVGLLPLYEEDSARLRLLGGVDVSDYLDVDRRWLAERRRCGTLSSSIASPSPSSGISTRFAPSRPRCRWCLRSPPRTAFRSTTAVEERCPVLALPATWDDYLAGLSGKDRHELRRKMRKLERELPGRRSSVAMTRPRAGTRRSACSCGCTASPRSARRVSWTSRWSASSATRRARWLAAGWARLWFLEHEGAAVASFLCFEYAGTVGPLQLRLRPGPRATGARHRPPGPRDHGRDRSSHPDLRFPPRRGALQAGLRSDSGGSLQREDPTVKLRVAMLSVHTCPLAAPGGKETGGMNVYVRETARELSRMGAHVDVFTRSQNPSIPRVVDMGHGARVIHLAAGPEAPMPREDSPPSPGRVRGRRRGVPLGRGARLRPDPRPLLALGRGRTCAAGQRGACRSCRCSTRWDG